MSPVRLDAAAPWVDTRTMSDLLRLSVRIEGVVQGVGFRPFVHSLAGRFGLSGHVGNDSYGVFAEVEGPEPATEEFLAAVRAEAPPLAVVDRLHAERLPVRDSVGFDIVASPDGGQPGTLVSADSATCDDCLAELADPADPRYRYPFINCTNCGPRFTIVRGVPYDRPLTTMSRFAMCADCATEYENPADRRFHAQPVCCPECGPELRLDGVAEDALGSAVARLAGGEILAIKGLGGYHLAVDAALDAAAGTLRARKHREDKPFAVLVPDLDWAARLCEVDGLAESMLSGRRKPIVLLPRRTGAPIAAAVAPGNRQLGIMLPYTPLHHLLAAELGRPIVLTSANVSDEPIVYRDDEARERLAGIADGFLTHDREIHIRTDDSIVRPFHGREQLQRRSRGYAPEPVPTALEFSRHVLACGAELKNTFCLAKQRHAFLSHHIGDLENYETLSSFTAGIRHFEELFDIHPDVVAHDLHPEYLSTKYAMEREDVELVGVQHHHAHIAACLADNGVAGPVLGVAFDGLGYGTDGTIWGGEFLRADLAGFSRLGHLETVPMPGGTAAIKQPWRMTAAYLRRLDVDTADLACLDVFRRNESRWSEVCSLAEHGFNAPATSSAGRLFDAVAALLGVRDMINYEGQAAVELEQCTDPDERAGYPADVADGETFVLAGPDLLRGCVDDLLAGLPVPRIAGRFHNGLVAAIVHGCRLAERRTGLRTVALSGGVFQNLLLLDATVRALTQADFEVLTHARVPTNDGGVSLGQAVIAAATC